MSSAICVKNEGNNLYTAGNYIAAHAKYTQAIELDGSNTVFWANRGACLLAMERYTEAASDCREATRLDPTYTKAWMRLATALKKLGMHKECIAMYQKAQSTLPKENLTSEHRNIARQCDLEIRAVREQTEQPPNTAHGAVHGEPPWVRAVKIIAELESHGPTSEEFLSSAWPVLKTYGELKEGMRLLRPIRRYGEPNRIEGLTCVIPNLTNAILADTRIFHIEQGWDIRDFLRKFELQVLLDTARDKCDTSGAQACIKHSLKLRESGWDVVRRSVSTTVRIWIMRGFFEHSLKEDFNASLGFFDNVLEVLEWGRRFWPDEPKENRGAVFQKTFLRGVRCLRLETLMKATMAFPAKYPLNDLYEAARELLKDVEGDEASPEERNDPAHFSSFYVYPRGQAKSVMALYYREMAKLHQRDLGTMWSDYLERSAEAYFNAATVYPQDDDYHTWYLKSALEINYDRHAPVSVVLPLFKLLEVSFAASNVIWEFSPHKMAHPFVYVDMLERGGELRKAVRDGRIFEEDTISWDRILCM